MTGYKSSVIYYYAINTNDEIKQTQKNVVMLSEIRK